MIIHDILFLVVNTMLRIRIASSYQEMNRETIETSAGGAKWEKLSHPTSVMTHVIHVLVNSYARESV